jgi:hypothetical protein
MGPSMMESGNSESIMALAHFNGLMVVHIRENGKIVEKMVKESFQELMVLSSKENGKMENIKAKNK